jgi:hypothetical protein
MPDDDKTPTYSKAAMTTAASPPPKGIYADVRELIVFGIAIRLIIEFTS